MRRPLRRRPLKRKADHLARPNTEGASHRGIPDRRLDSGAHHDLVGPAESAPATIGRPKQRLDQAVLGPWRQLEVHVDLAGDPLHQAQQQMRGSEPQVVLSLTLGERQRVNQLDAAVVGRKRRLEHERSGLIPAFAAERATGGD